MKTTKTVTLLSLATFAGLGAGAQTAGRTAAQAAGDNSGKAGGKAPLNVLLFTADDLEWSSLGCWGCKMPDVSPNIDNFAKQSHMFRNSHVTIAVSQPSRGALATGMYPHTSGVEGFYHSPGYVPTVMSELRKHGYLVGILGKCEHSTPDGDFVWDMMHDMGELGQGRNPQKYADYFREFLERCKKEGKPFYFMCNSHDPHRPFSGSPQDLEWQQKFHNYPLPSRVYTPEEVEVPGFLPDIQAVRVELAQYFSSVHRCDQTFGAVMKVLDDEGLADNTLVVFLSDNGMSQPFAKTNTYYNSTRTPLMVRYPGVTKAGTLDETDFVSGIDFMPTVLDACGFQAPPSTDGRSYLPLLRGEKQTGWDRVFTQFYETSAKGRFPMFAVQDADWLFIYSPWSDGTYRFKNDSQGGIAFKGMVEAGKSDSYIQGRVDLLLYRVPLELYDLKKDPDAIHNLAKDKKYAPIVKQYSDLLLGWMKRYDPTVLPAFAAFPSETERAKYMEAQKQIPVDRKAAAAAAKASGKSKKSQFVHEED